ncbi:hypothetical protein GCM10027562_37590 [Arthrobacter pigmenti]
MNSGKQETVSPWQRTWHITARLFASLVLMSGVSFAAIPPASAASDGVPVSAQQEVNAAAWIPYDYSRITPESKCEARRSWLIRNVSWVKRSNSDCFSYWTNKCPPKQYWMVVVKQYGFAKFALENTVVSGVPSVRVAAAC